MQASTFFGLPRYHHLLLHPCRKAEDAKATQLLKGAAEELVAYYKVGRYLQQFEKATVAGSRSSPSSWQQQPRIDTPDLHMCQADIDTLDFSFSSAVLHNTDADVSQRV